MTRNCSVGLYGNGGSQTKDGALRALLHEAGFGQGLRVAAGRTVAPGHLRSIDPHQQVVDAESHESAEEVLCRVHLGAIGTHERRAPPDLTLDD